MQMTPRAGPYRSEQEAKWKIYTMLITVNSMAMVSNNHIHETTNIKLLFLYHVFEKFAL